MNIGSSDLIALLALVVASGALFLEIRRWFESAPRLALLLMSDMVLSEGDDGSPKAALFVTNRGLMPTTVTHMVVFTYKTRLHRLLDRRQMSAIVNTWRTEAGLPNLPFELLPNRQWTGVLRYDDEILKARQEGRLYIGVHASHSEKAKLIRVSKKPSTVQAKAKSSDQSSASS